MATRATALLASDEQLLLADLVLAECIYMLESYYEVDRTRVAELMRGAIALPTIKTVAQGPCCARSRSTSSTASTSRRPISWPRRTPPR
jgi:hypothetical protein